MDNLTQSFSIAMQAFPNQKEVGIELLYFFPNENQAIRYYQHIYHPDNTCHMIQVHGVGNKFICGFLSVFDFEKEHIKSIVECYSEIANRYDGQLQKLRFHKGENPAALE